MKVRASVIVTEVATSGRWHRPIILRFRGFTLGGWGIALVRRIPQATQVSGEPTEGER